MGVIDWTPSAGAKPKVTPYVWVYWAVAVPLTITVIIVWRIWWKIEDAKYQQQLSKAMQDYDRKKSLFENVEKQGSTPGGLSWTKQERLNEMDVVDIHTGNLIGHFERRKKSSARAANFEIPEC